MAAIAVPAQRTWNVGEVATAAMLNSNIHDAVTFLLNKPTMSASQATAQSLPNAAWTAVTYDTNDVVDAYGGHSTSVNPSQYVAPVTGWYLVRGTVAFATNGTGARLAEITVMGIGYQHTEQLAANPGGVSVVQVSGYCYLNSGQYVQVNAYQSSGGALATLGGKYSSMQVEWVHA